MIFLDVPLLVWVVQEFASLLENLHFLEEVDELDIKDNFKALFIHRHFTKILIVIGLKFI